MCMLLFMKRNEKAIFLILQRVCIPGDGWNIDSSEVINIQSKNGIKDTC